MRRWPGIALNKDNLDRTDITTERSRTLSNEKLNKASKGAPPLTELILQLYEVGCIQFGQFSLVSGQQSPIYIDLRRLMARPALLKAAGEVYAGLLAPLSFDHIAAVPYAALTIGTAVALVANKPLIYPRKEVKSHGTGRAVEGVFAAGERAVIIEDLVTKGGSALKAIKALEAVDLTVSDVVVLIDRQEGGREALAEAGYRLHAVFRLSEILEILRQEDQISAEQLTVVKNYLKSTGA